VKESVKIKQEKAAKAWRIIKRSSISKQRNQQRKRSGEKAKQRWRIISA